MSEICILRWEFSLGGFYLTSKLKIDDFKILLFVSQKIRESTTLPLENTSRSKGGHRIWIWLRI